MRPTPRELYDRRVEWADSLPSFRQGREVLSRRSSSGTVRTAHCCLGVQCVLGVRAGRLLETDDPDVYTVEYRPVNPGPDTDLGWRYDCLPPSESDYLGLRPLSARTKNLFGSFVGSDGDRVSMRVGAHDHTSLSGANDNGATFADISAFVREQAEVALSGEFSPLFV